MEKLIIGCGYLGRRVAEAWLQQGHRVSALTRSAEHADEFRSQGLEPVIGDVTDRNSLSSLPEADAVLYAVGFDRNAGKTMRSVYVDGLKNVLDSLAGATHRFLYISSTSVYGQSDGEWVNEESPCEPVRDNGVICREAERLLQDRLPQANILRLAGIYGPGRLLRRVQAVQSGEPVRGHPDAWLNLIHVDDAVRAVLACEQRGDPGRTYLVADDSPLTRREYYGTLSRLLEAPDPVFAESEQQGSSPSRHTRRGLNKRCCNRRLHEELDVSLQYPSAAEGLAQALAGGADQ